MGLYKKVLLATIAVGVFLGQGATVSADAPGVYGIGIGQGYLTGATGTQQQFANGDTNCIPRRPNGQAGTHARVLCEGVHSNTKEEFIGHIMSRLSGNHQQRVGGSFIIYSMLGYNGSNNGQGRPLPLLPNDAGHPVVARWLQIVRDNAVTMHSGIVSYSINSAYVKYPGNNFDVAFYADSGSADSITFKYNGRTVYVIKKDCANPIGDTGFPDVIPSISWSIRGESYAKKNTTDNSQRRQGSGAISSAQPGDTVYWDHDLRNNGPNNMDRSINIWVQTREYDLNGNALTGWSNVISSSGRGNNGNVFYNSQNNRKTITQDDVGKRICQRVAWQPAASSNNGSAASNPACVTIPYNYNLTPTINVPVDSINEGETTIPNITSRIEHSGPTKTEDVKYAVVRFIVRDDEETVIPGGDGAGATGADWACALSAEVARRTGLNIDSTVCANQELAKQEGSIISIGGIDVPFLPGKNPNDISGLDISLGDRICYMAAVSRYNQDTNGDTFRYSKPSCIRIAKKPKLQLWGADVRAGGKISTSITNRNGVYYGGWAEYGVFAQGEARTASGAGLSANEAGRTGVGGAGTYNALTFANQSRFGAYGTIPQTALAPMFTDNNGGAGRAEGARNVESLATGSTISQWTAGDVEITGGTVPAGKTIIIKSTGTVTISGDIKYAGGNYNAASGLPQMIIIAQNIIINDAVGQVESWLITRSGGYVSTCGPVSAGAWLNNLSHKVCDKQLTISGPVIADHLYLRRTFGANKENPGTPAEVINLRPDTYLWAYGMSRDTGAIKTMYLRELPPRF